MSNSPFLPSELTTPPPPPLLEINWRKVALVLLLLIGLALVARPAWRLVQRWNQAKLLKQGRAFLDQKDYRSAALTGQQLYLANPYNLKAITLLADISEETASPEAIFWRSRVMELEGRSVQSVLEMAATALRLGEGEIAAQALEMIAPTNRQGLTFHEVSAGVALANRQLARAEFHFGQAVALAPTNDLLRYNLAALQLESAQREKVEQGRKALQQYRSVPRVKLLALRSLMADAQRMAQTNQVLSLARELAFQTPPHFDDQLLYLEALLWSGSGDYPGFLEKTRQQARTNARAAAAFLHWLLRHGKNAEAVAWSASLPQEIKQELPIRLLVAETLVRLKDWNGLQKWVDQGQWGVLEGLRMAMLTRVNREKKLVHQSMVSWEKARSESSLDTQLLYMLARLVEGWGWKEESEPLYWSLAMGQWQQKAALQSLYRLYADQRDTPKLYRVALRVLQLEPSNPIARNNVAALSLLLRQNLESASRLAQENYTQHRNVIEFRSTWAFSLHLQNRSAEALEVLNGIPEAQFNAPGMNAYYGIILAGAGKKEPARVQLQRALSAGNLLPEELALIRQAMALLGNGK